MPTLKEIEKMEQVAGKKQAEARALTKKARLARARLPKAGGRHGGPRDGSGRKAKETEKRVQESVNLLPSTLEGVAAWAREASATRGKKVSPRVLVEAATREALGLPLDDEALWALGRRATPFENDDEATTTEAQPSA